MFHSIVGCTLVCLGGHALVWVFVSLGQSAEDAASKPRQADTREAARDGFRISQENVETLVVVWESQSFVAFLKTAGYRVYWTKVTLQFA